VVRELIWAADKVSEASAGVEADEAAGMKLEMSLI